MSFVWAKTTSKHDKNVQWFNTNKSKKYKGSYRDFVWCWSALFFLLSRLFASDRITESKESKKDFRIKTGTQ